MEEEDEFADSIHVYNVEGDDVSPKVLSTKPAPTDAATSTSTLASNQGSQSLDTDTQRIVESAGERDSSAANVVGAQQKPAAKIAASDRPQEAADRPIAASDPSESIANNEKPNTMIMRDPAQNNDAAMTHQNPIIILASAAAGAAANAMTAQITQQPLPSRQSNPIPATRQTPMLAQAAPLPMAPRLPQNMQTTVHVVSAAAAGPSEPEQPPRKPTNVPVIPISSIETQVCKAARLVAVELEHGGWPEARPGTHLQAAAAVEEFAKTIFLPNLLRNHGAQNLPSNKRVFLASMLALREVLTQNASRIFQLDSVPVKEQISDQMVASGNKRRKRQDKEEEREYMAQLLATSVIFAAIQSLPEAHSYLPRFTEMMDSYDAGSDEFCSCMERLDGGQKGIMPNTKELKKEENVAWKVSYNRAREVHPVISRASRRMEHQSESSHIIKVPRPNTVFISMAEDCSKR